MHGYEWPAPLEGCIYSHKKNSGNNSDSFLIHLHCDSQPFMVGDRYNDDNCYLPWLKNQEDIIFVVFGNLEIRDLLCFFDGIRLHAR